MIFNDRLPDPKRGFRFYIAASKLLYIIKSFSLDS